MIIHPAINQRFIYALPIGGAFFARKKGRPVAAQSGE
tara:strand:+ start:821 stop:931 length:111 start_codon:yes stop_codon:yes gene_type:complete